MIEVYRKSVGIVVTKNKKVLLCARADCKDWQWQFPQGGIEKGETPFDAAIRELREETAITNVRLLAEIKHPLKYNFPVAIVKKFQSENKRVLGQEQHWFLFEFLGKDGDIDFNTNPQEIEFKSFMWADLSEAPQKIVAFKKDVYQKVADEFRNYIEGTS